MACLTPLTIRNPRYKKEWSERDISIPPSLRFVHDAYIVVPCGKCVHCRRRRAMDWRFRCLQEYKYSSHGRFHFVTFTFSDEHLHSLSSELNCSLDSNEIAILAVRRFCERYRKRFGVSIRHLFVSELGESTGRLHLHGILVDCKAGTWKRNKFYADVPLIKSIWKYGNVWFGWCNERSISYVLKYIMKHDANHPNFVPKLLVSPGFGKAYVCDANIRWHHSGNLKWYCVTSSGHKIAIPRYYRLKIFTESELRARSFELWLDPPDYVFKDYKCSSLDEYLDGTLNYDLYTKNIGLYFGYVKHSSYICGVIEPNIEFNSF